MSHTTSALPVVSGLQQGSNIAQCRRGHIRWYNLQLYNHKYNNRKRFSSSNHYNTSTQTTSSPTKPYIIHKRIIGNVRLVCEHFNGFTPWQLENNKIILAKSFIKQVLAVVPQGLNADPNGVCYIRHIRFLPFFNQTVQLKQSLHITKVKQ